MPAVAAAVGAVEVDELGVATGVGLLELELDALDVSTGIEEEELLDKSGVLEAGDETNVLLGVEEMLLGELPLLTDTELAAGIEELLEDEPAELLALGALVLVDGEVLLLGVMKLLVDD